MREGLQPPAPDQGSQSDWDAYLQSKGEGVFDPAAKSPDPHKRTEKVGEVSLDAIQAGQIPLDRADEIGLADHQPDTPLEAVQRADRVEEVREYLDRMPNTTDAEILRRRSGLNTETGQPETIKEIAKSEGVTVERVRQRIVRAKAKTTLQIARSGEQGHPIDDYRNGLDKH